ncbi:unnamed protein product, partial [marine sediment metagenome]
MGIETGTAVLLGSGIAAGAGLYGSKKASEAQEKGADAATAAELEMYYQGREDLAPWRREGAIAVNKLERLIQRGPGKFD